MIDNNIQLFQAAYYGTPPLIAIKKIKHCIEQGADVDLILYKDYETVDIPNINYGFISQYYNCTLLVVAIKGGHIHIVKTLIEKGADYNYIDNTNDTPLSIALSVWYKAYIYKTYYNKQLKNMNAVVSSKCTSYWPLDEEIRQYNILQYLINIGAKLHINEPNNRKMANAFIHRQQYQRLADQLLEWVINEKTNSSIGTAIVQTQAFISEHYLSFVDFI